jgi:hypothetical protein
MEGRIDLMGSAEQSVSPESGGFPWKGGKLIALDPNVGSLDSPVVKPMLV